MTVWTRNMRIAGALIVLLAVAVRFYGLNWDSLGPLSPSASFAAPLVAHPDERGFLNRIQELGKNSWNPGTYSPLTLYIIKFAASLMARIVDPAWGQYEHLALIGRFLSACFGAGAVLLTLLLGARAFSPAVGLGASLLLALNVLHIQASHFLAPDSFLVFFVVAALLAAVSYLHNGNLVSILLCGVLAGLATASKFNGIGLLPVLLILPWLRRRTAPAADSTGSALTVSLAGFVCAFLVAAPYAVLEPSVFWGRIGAEQMRALGADMPWNIRQYLHTPRFIYPIGQLVSWGFGLPTGILVLAAAVWAGERAVRSLRHGVKQEEDASLLVILAWLVPGFLFTACSQVMVPRYLLPFYPQLCLLGALVLQELRRSRRWAAAAVAGVVGVAAVLWCAAFLRIYTVPHPYVQATIWAMENVPAGTKIALEDMNEEVPLNIGGRFRMGVRIPFYHLPDTPQKARQVARVLSLADAFSVPSSTVWATLIRLQRPDPRKPEIVYPYSAAIYRLLMAGRLGYSVEASFTRYPGLFGLEVNDDAVNLSDPDLAYRCDQSFTFYDHPKVLYFRNSERLDETELYRRIQEEAGKGGK